jgi:hypothetical protein
MATTAELYGCGPLQTDTVLTVITPTRNAQETLERCLRSVSNQDFVNWEHWILDALSSDRTVEIAQRAAARDPRVRVISEQDEGIYDAMNKGIHLARGEWVYFLGADDELFDAEVLAKMLIEQNADCDVLYGNVLRVPRQDIYDGPFDLGKLLTRNICHQAIFYRRELFERLGGFDLRFPILADWEFNLRCMLDPTVRFRHVDEVVARFRLGGASIRPEPGWHEVRMAMLGRRFGLAEQDQALLSSVLDNLVRRTVAAEEIAESLGRHHASLQRVHADLIGSPAYRLLRAVMWPVDVIREALGGRNAGNSRHVP